MAFVARAEKITDMVSEQITDEVPELRLPLLEHTASGSEERGGRGVPERWRVSFRPVRLGDTSEDDYFLYSCTKPASDMVGQ